MGNTNSSEALEWLRDVHLYNSPALLGICGVYGLDGAIARKLAQSTAKRL